MSQFYVSDVASAGHCQHSLHDRKPITVSGIDVSDERMKTFTGLVQSVQDVENERSQGHRWLVTMLDVVAK